MMDWWLCCVNMNTSNSYTSIYNIHTLKVLTVGKLYILLIEPIIYHILSLRKFSLYQNWIYIVFSSSIDDESCRLYLVGYFFQMNKLNLVWEMSLLLIQNHFLSNQNENVCTRLFNAHTGVHTWAFCWHYMSMGKFITSPKIDKFWRLLNVYSVFIFWIINLPLVQHIINLNCCNYLLLSFWNIQNKISFNWFFQTNFHFINVYQNQPFAFPSNGDMMGFVIYKNDYRQFDFVTVTKDNLCKYIGLKLDEKFIQIYAHRYVVIGIMDHAAQDSVENCSQFINRKCHCAI